MRSVHCRKSLRLSAMNHHRAGRPGALDCEAIELFGEGTQKRRGMLIEDESLLHSQSTYDIFQGLDRGIRVLNQDMGPFRAVALGGVARWVGRGQSLVDMVPRDADKEIND